MREAPPLKGRRWDFPSQSRWNVRLRLITPMFGGGVRPRQSDSTEVVRASAVRGQLRFWWRALYARRHATAAELFDAEEQIFGSDRLPGAVQLTVKVERSGELVDYGQHPPKNPQLLYALFPFQENGRERKPWDKGRRDVRFAVSVAVGSAPADEVCWALKAWSTFGGVGARWRRGCGALAVVDSDLPSFPLPTLTNGGPPMVTQLSGGFYQGEARPGAEDAWAAAVGIYRRFRQGPGFGREHGYDLHGNQTNRPGRSRYPEADTIRRLRNAHAPQHRPRAQVDGYPRADLGLPIVFHYKDRGEPADQTLQGSEEGRSRFASPVLTRPLVVAGGYAPMIMVLKSPNVWAQPLELKQGATATPVPPGRVNLTPAELAQIQPLNGAGARAALLRELRHQRFTSRSIQEALR